MTDTVKKKREKKSWCPLDGTNYQGYCAEHSATIRVKSKKCNHRLDCEKLKNELDGLKNES
jgi:hypothetical protein